MNFKKIFYMFLIYQNIICESFINKNILKYNIINKHNIKISDSYNILINNKKIYFQNIVEKLKKKTNSFLHQ